MVNFEHARKMMVDTQLRPALINDSRLLSVMGRMPRERFVPDARRSIAYADIEHPLSDNGRSLASPAGFAKLLKLAEVDENDVVLDVGCGTGYSTAVLANLASAVVGLDNNPGLVEQANDILADLDIGNAAVLEGELAAGVPSEAPFDVIILEGAVAEVPPALFEQLRKHGRLVAMIGCGVTATAHVFVKTEREISVRPDFDGSLPNLLPPVEAPAFRL